MFPSTYVYTDLTKFALFHETQSGNMGKVNHQALFYVKVLSETRLLRRSHDNITRTSGEASSTFGHTNANFSVVYKPYKESISKEMNNND